MHARPMIASQAMLSSTTTVRRRWLIVASIFNSVLWLLLAECVDFRAGVMAGPVALVGVGLGPLFRDDLCAYAVALIVGTAYFYLIFIGILRAKERSRLALYLFIIMLIIVNYASWRGASMLILRRP